MSISGVFLEGATLRNKLLLGWSEGTSIRIQLIDPSDPQEFLLGDTSIDYAQTGVLPVLELPHSSTLLLYNQGDPPRPGAGQTLTAKLWTLPVVIQDGKATYPVTAISRNVPIPQAEPGTKGTAYFMSPAMRTSNLIYRVETHFDLRESYDYNVYNLSLVSVKQPVRIVGGTLSAMQTGMSAGPSLSFAGPYAYAYTDSLSMLHARLYESDLDVTLQRAGEMRIAFNANDYVKVLR